MMLLQVVETGLRWISESLEVHQLVDEDFSSQMTSSSTGDPSGRLATPKTRREETV
jgi:hypothetical protein